MSFCKVAYLFSSAFLLLVLVVEVVLDCEKPINVTMKRSIPKLKAKFFVGFRNSEIVFQSLVEYHFVKLQL